VLSRSGTSLTLEDPMEGSHRRSDATVTPAAAEGDGGGRSSNTAPVVPQKKAVKRYVEGGAFVWDWRHTKPSS